MLLLPCLPLEAGNRNTLNRAIPSINLGKIDQQLIDQHIQRMKTRGRLALKRALLRLELHRPMIHQQLRRRHLPNFLLYLPLVESNAVDTVVSGAGAAGLWQIMPSTARGYGLQVDEQTDERLDPRASTQVALRLLNDLYREYKDWPLALAAYNCGTARVDRAIRLAKSRRYARLRKFLPRQTRAYVPRFFAYVAIGQNPGAYGISVKRPSVRKRHCGDSTTNRRQVLLNLAAVRKAPSLKLPMHKRAALSGKPIPEAGLQPVPQAVALLTRQRLFALRRRS